MPLSVLVVENESVVAEDLQSALVPYGYTIHGVAKSYEQAMRLLWEKGKPDIALIDISLDTERNSLALGKLFMETYIPFIYVSSYTDPGILKDAELTEPFGFLTKPFSRESVCSMVEMAYASVKLCVYTMDKPNLRLF
jgi:CheY-like chemotaxis protein